MYLVINNDSEEYTNDLFIGNNLDKYKYDFKLFYDEKDYNGVLDYEEFIGDSGIKEFSAMLSIDGVGSAFYCSEDETLNYSNFYESDCFHKKILNLIEEEFNLYFNTNENINEFIKIS